MLPDGSLYMDSTKAHTAGQFGVITRESGRLMREAAPSRKLMFSQLEEALRTGGVGARIPIIQRAVGDVQAATTRAMGQSREQFARAGIGGSPIALQSLAQQQMAGSQAAARIPTEIAGQIIGAGPQMVAGQEQQALGGFATAGAAAQQAQMARAQMRMQLIGALGKSIGGGLSGLLGGGE